MSAFSALTASTDTFLPPGGRQVAKRIDPLADVCGTGRVRLIFDDHHERSGRAEAIGDGGIITARFPMDGLAASIPCLTPGVRVATDAGLRPVRDLAIGDKLVTRDNGAQVLRWIGRRVFTWRMLALLPFLQPVQIRAGAFGDGMPAADLLVSGNHLMLVCLPDAGEVLVPARDLMGRPGIGRACCDEVCYVQLLFDRHELLLTENCWSESFRPTPDRLSGIGAAAHMNLEGQFPDALTAGAAIAPARPLQHGAIADPLLF